MGSSKAGDWNELGDTYPPRSVGRRNERTCETVRISSRLIRLTHRVPHSCTLTVRRWPKVQEAGGAQLVDARQLGQGVQPEIGEEVWGRCPEEWAAGAGAPPLGTDPARLHQGVDRALAERHSADLPDLGAGHRLGVGDDRKRLDRRTRQLAGDPSLDPQSVR